MIWICKNIILKCLVLLTELCDWDPLGYHVFWKNDGLALDKSILTRFNEQVTWFIKNGAEDEQEKAKYLNIRFKINRVRLEHCRGPWDFVSCTSDSQKDGRAQHHFSVANRILTGENNTSESNPFHNDESATSKQSHYYALRKKQKVDYNINQMSERTYSEEFQMDVQETFTSKEFQVDNQETFTSEVDIFKTPKIEMLASLNTKSHLESYNIVCLFDIEFPYTKQLFMKLSTNQVRTMKSKWTEAETYISKEEIEKHWNECPLKKLVDDNQMRIRFMLISTQEDERGKLGDKHDGILYMNINGIKIGVGFVEVVGNAFTSNISDKNDDLEKLLKAMMVSLYYQRVHQSDDENTSQLQSFAILVFGLVANRKCHRNSEKF
ncbi:9446_t:CDS:10 [Rhizophagus irregularis]|nr:9446_t:CDS:10 [Rhizophagus irregularis]